MKKMWVLGLVAAFAVGSVALAGEPGVPKEKPKGGHATGTFASATLEGENILWKINTEGVEKTYEMGADVVVLYTEKGGQKNVASIGSKGRRAVEAKGKQQVAEGKFVKAALEGGKVSITVKVADAEQIFVLTQEVSVSYREKQGKLLANRITPAAKKERKGEKAGGVAPPENR
jgi:hypothetical protein